MEGGEKMSEEKIIQRVPLWLAVAITVLVSLPFGLFLGKYNIALWASFVVWAEYFALGGTTEGFKYILGSYPIGALSMAIFAVINNYFIIQLKWNPNISVAIWIFVWVAIAVYIMKFHEIFNKGSLPYFNGLSMYLAFYFSGLKAGFGAGPLTGNPFIDPWILWIWVVLAAILGSILGWFNILITFPKKIT
jgi:hypothetical protein